VGEAKRRREAEARHGPMPPHVFPSGLTWAQIEEIASEDPDDREIRLSHGFGRDDPDDRMCPRGCGWIYGDVTASKMRTDHE
jgi:hypothetical protein